ncbi:hypothetical protein OSB04_005470 [Centaurea solstitialis]|uniref:MADS-box domain-containing protein n=1 Tax=Centaurea solstitialis TaxID=347529 RepID=A0AA38TG29_9ASTR|nr:hypothetical protein OSB04_005470 [Centaurea solstitialis]
MGRGKIEIKRIENTSNRQVTYSKRKNGIIKKAKEITVLCDANVSLVIYGSSGKMYEYCSPKTNLIDMLDRYQRLSGNKLWDAKHEDEIPKIMRKHEQVLEEENKHLMYLVQQSEMAAMGDYQAHEPFSFRVQPMQPNLHERM